MAFSLITRCSLCPWTERRSGPRWWWKTQSEDKSMKSSGASNLRALAAQRNMDFNRRRLKTVWHTTPTTVWHTTPSNRLAYHPAPFQFCILPLYVVVYGVVTVSSDRDDDGRLNVCVRRSLKTQPTVAINIDRHITTYCTLSFHIIGFIRSSAVLRERTRERERETERERQR